MARQTCFNCRWFKPSPSKEWEPEYPSQVFDLFHLRTILVKAGLTITSSGWPGTCTLTATPAKVTSSYLCDSWKVNFNFLKGWGEFSDELIVQGDLDRLTNEIGKYKELARKRYRLLHKPKAAKE